MNEQKEEFHHAGLLKGYLRFAILKALEKRPLHGYAIIKRIEEITVVWKPTTGSIYPMLFQMAREGLVHIKGVEEKGRKKKVYQITKKGRADLKTQKKKISEMRKCMDRMFQKLLPKEAESPRKILELISRSNFLKKELFELRHNVIRLLVLHTQGKTQKGLDERIKGKMLELNELMAKAVGKKI